MKSVIRVAEQQSAGGRPFPPVAQPSCREIECKHGADLCEQEPDIRRGVETDGVDQQTEAEHQELVRRRICIPMRAEWRAEPRHYLLPHGPHVALRSRLEPREGFMRV